MNIVWTRHAEERQSEWEKKRGITIEHVETCLTTPDQVVSGHRYTKIAQVKLGNGLLRIPHVEKNGNLVILTLYWTSKVSKYWVEDIDETDI